jgi:hypothetical protein
LNVSKRKLNRNSGNKKNPLNQRIISFKTTAADWNKWKDRTCGIKDKIDTNEKEESLDKKLKSCKSNTLELCDSIKRPNLQIKAIEEGEGFKTKKYIM